ncbi:MAG: nucleotidyltransferase domain-containing protein [Nitrospirae bacterium]|nr:nucleotidyltransferase domain-containing protein [Nitrospirota bacterium]
MREKDRIVAVELKRRLSAIVQLVDFKVFGSRARGDDDEYSDLDVFIEVEALSPSLKEEISDIVWEVGYQNDMVISPRIFTRDELERSPLRASSIVKAIADEGVPV